MSRASQLDSLCGQDPGCRKNANTTLDLFVAGCGAMSPVGAAVCKWLSDGGLDTIGAWFEKAYNALGIPSACGVGDFVGWRDDAIRAYFTDRKIIATRLLQPTGIYSDAQISEVLSLAESAITENYKFTRPDGSWILAEHPPAVPAYHWKNKCMNSGFKEGLNYAVARGWYIPLVEALTYIVLEDLEAQLPPVPTLPLPRPPVHNSPDLLAIRNELIRVVGKIQASL